MDAGAAAEVAKEDEEEVGADVSCYAMAGNNINNYILRKGSKNTFVMGTGRRQRYPVFVETIYMHTSMKNKVITHVDCFLKFNQYNLKSKPKPNKC